MCNGQCPGSLQAPMKTISAEYKRIFSMPTTTLLREQFGITPPAEWTFSLTVQ
ncbi:MAG: hypothetical protein AMXMBFR34_13440 [Myxococcaceae bacterium]